MSSPQVEGESDLPRKIGNYRVEERLGAGGMGVVYRAFDEVLQRPLAIKHLLSPPGANPTAARRFRREAQMAARLNHPAIVHIYDVVETPDGDWIVMELVEGQTLSALVREGGLELSFSVRLGREIAEGLAEAHVHGIVHRDLKTGNVMVTKSGHAKILDFGLAKLVYPDELSDLSQAGVIFGTYHAMSPEQAQGLPLDHRSDLFSLGVLLYEMFSGVSPFRATTAPETLRRICSLPHVPLHQIRQEVPRDLSSLIDRLLDKEAARRFQSALEVARALDEIALPIPPPAGVSGPHTRPLADGDASQRPEPVEESTLAERLAGDRAGRDRASWPTPPASSPDPSRPTGERRQLTVVYCELAGADGAPLHISDPEVLYERMLELRALAAAAAGRYGGHLGSALGHRVLIQFGYPQTYEDNARRAVLTALELAAEVARTKAGAGPGDPGRLALRAGVHTGPAVVSPQSPEPVMLGATLDAAVELQALADAGCVVVSPATGALIQKSFSLAALPTVVLPGHATPWIPLRVLAPLHAPEDSAGEAAALVGREREMELLLNCWSLVAEGTGQAILVSGEAGIGKSRLVHAAKGRLGGAVKWLSCGGSPYGQSSPLRPVIDLLRQAIASQQGGSPLDQLESLLRDCSLTEAVPLVAALLDLPLEGRHPAPGLAPERQRDKTLEALVAWMLEMAERQPLVLLIEDLHWLDPTTLDWLGRLIDQVSAAPLFLVLTLRLPAAEPLRIPLTSLTQITLSPLSEAEAEILLDQVTGARPLAPEIRRQIIAKTDGVPLFLEELAKAVLEASPSEEARELPATLRDSLAARLDRLGGAKEIAQLASVIGRTFSLELLAAVSLQDEAALLVGLRRLIQAELIYRKGFGAQTRYLFKHALVQDAAYDSLLKRERQQLHRRIAGALESRFPEIAETQPELLAHHYAGAGLAETAAGFWLRAGRIANGRSANSEAVMHFQQALGLLESLPESVERHRRELEVQSALAAALIAGRGFLDPAVEQAYARAEALAGCLEETEERFWAVVGLHTFHVAGGDFAQALRLAERLLRIAEESGSPILLSIAHFWLGTYLYYRADFAAALPQLERAFELAPPGDDTYRQRTGVDLRVLTLCFAALVLWHLGFPDRAWSRGGQAVALARELGHPFTLSFARGLGGAVIAHYRRDAPAARREARAVLDLAAELDFPLWIWQSTFLLVWACLEAPADCAPPVALGAYGDPATIEKLAGSGMDYYFCLYAEILRLQGRSREALAALERCLPVARERGAAWTGELHRLQGEILRSEPGGGADRVEDLFRTALELARQCGSRSLELRAALSLGGLWRSLGREAEARDLVAGVYSGFGEGFETQDLREAGDFLGARAGESA